MAKKQFKAESKRLLDLMINSIYTHKEIFLRELISNASDATDKLYYNAMKEGKTGITRDSLPIELTLDKENRKFIIEDHGMRHDGGGAGKQTLVRSRARDRLLSRRKNENMDDVDIIGQFGVGFYAAFMVASHVEVVSRALWQRGGQPLGVGRYGGLHGNALRKGGKRHEDHADHQGEHGKTRITTSSSSRTASSHWSRSIRTTSAIRSRWT